MKAKDAQTERSDVELEPAWRAAAKLGNDQTSEPELQARAPNVRCKDAQTEHSVVELEPAWGAAAELGNDQTSESELQARAPDVKAEDYFN